MKLGGRIEKEKESKFLAWMQIKGFICIPELWWMCSLLSAILVYIVSNW